MKYRPLNDLIDPDVPAFDGINAPEGLADPDSGNDAYVFDEHGHTVSRPDNDKSKAEQEVDGRMRWGLPVAIALVAACVILTGWNITRLASGGPPAPNPSPFQIKQGLYLGVMRVEAFRRSHGVTPDDAPDVGLTDPPYHYTRVSSTEYTLGLEAHGQKIEYSSRMSMQHFFGSPKEMLAMGGAQ
jgi:hypothetical protein